MSSLIFFFYWNRDYQTSIAPLYLQQCLILMDLTDSSFMVKEKEAGDVSRFLNRILGLSVEKQNLVSKLLWL